MQVILEDKPEEMRLFAESKEEIELLKKMRDSGIDITNYEEGGEWGWAELTIRPKGSV